MSDRVRSIGAYAFSVDGEGRQLAVGVDGRHALPGALVRHGEHPATAVVRAVAGLGLTATINGVREVSASITRGARAERHHDRIVFDVSVVGGPPVGDAGWTDAAVVFPEPPAPATVDDGQPRVQRFAAYGFVVDPAGDRVLLTRIARNYPGAGRWHLPGGGTDFGEQPAEALLRELYEETGQRGRVEELLHISHRHHPAARGPEGYPIDWHSVRALFRLSVDVPTEPSVTEAAGGSTADARWFPRADLASLDVTEVVITAASRHSAWSGSHGAHG